jgi:hypothetical protein
MKTAYFRFYEELNDFLPKEKQKVRFAHNFLGRVSIKDMIESIGVPHTEIDMILVNGEPVDFKYLVKDRDEISVYPVFESFDISDVQKVREKPLRLPKFILDVHLGKLAKLLRLLGFDTYYRNDLEDEEIIQIAQAEKRTILTKDLGILKQNAVTHGYYVRATKPEVQLEEVTERFHLNKEMSVGTRCIDCNTILETVKKSEIIDRIPPKVKKYYEEFYICRTCDKIYWKGSHYESMQKIVDRIRNKYGD